MLRESRLQGVWAALLVAALLAGCQGGGGSGTGTGAEALPAAKTEQVTIAMTGGVDKSPVQLDSRVADAVVWTNSGDEAITIEFVSGPGTIEVPAHGQSRPVAVSEFGGRGSYPYRIRAGSRAMSQAADTTGGPGEPVVDVGP